MAYRPGYSPEDFLRGTTPNSSGQTTRATGSYGTYRQGYTPEDFLNGTVGTSPSKDKASILREALHYGTLPFNLVWKGAQTTASALANAATRGDPFAAMRVQPGSSFLSDLGQTERATSVPQVVETAAHAVARAAAPEEALDPMTVSGLRELDPIRRKSFERRNPLMAGTEAAAEAVGDLPVQLATVPIPGVGRTSLDPALGLMGALGRAASLGRALPKAREVGIAAGEMPTAKAMAELMPASDAIGRASAAKILAEAARSRGAASPITARLMDSPKVAKRLERAIGASFLPGMAVGAASEIPEAVKSYREEGLTPRTIKHGVGGATSAVFAGLGAKHALKPGSAPIDREIANIEKAASRETPMEAEPISEAVGSPRTEAPVEGKFAKEGPESARQAEESIGRDWNESIKRLYPQASRISKQADNSYVVRMQDGSRLKVNPEAQIEIPSKDSVSSMVQGEGEPIAATRTTGEPTVAIPVDVAIDFAKGREVPDPVLAHEVFHHARKALGISDKSFIKRFEPYRSGAETSLRKAGIEKANDKQLADAIEEIVADEYAKGYGSWTKGNKDIFGRVRKYWDKLTDNVMPTQKELFRKIEAGEFSDKPTAEWYRWLSKSLSDYSRGVGEAPSVLIANGQGPKEEPKFKASDEIPPTSGEPRSPEDAAYRRALEKIPEAERMVAAHSLEQNMLPRLLELGEIPAPSVAVTKQAPPRFGDVTLLLRKSAIDPEASPENVIYKGDAMTPTAFSTKAAREASPTSEKILEEIKSKPAAKEGAEELPSLEAARAVEGERYNEAKPLRNVKFDEVAAAIVPDWISPQALEALRKMGVSNIEAYSANRQDPRLQDVERFEAVKKLSEAEDVPADIRFKKEPEPLETKDEAKPPLVEHNVKNLEQLGKELQNAEDITPETSAKIDKLRKLDRDAPRTWASLEGRSGEIAKMRTLQEWTNQILSKRPMSDTNVIALEKVVANEIAARNKMIEERKAAVERDDIKAVEELNSRLTAEGMNLAVLESVKLNDGSSAGRALAARKYISSVTGDRLPSPLLSRIMREIPHLDPVQAAVLEQTLHANPAEFADAFRAAMKPGVMDKVMEFWKSGLVSGLPTQAANTFSNAAEQTVRVFENMTSAQVQKMLQGKDAPRSIREAAAEWTGTRAAFGPAWKRLMQDFTKAFKLEPESIDLESGKPIEYSTGAIAGKKGRAVRLPFRILDAMDMFFQEIALSRETHKLVYREALKEVGLNKKDAFPAYERILREIEAKDKKWGDLRIKALESARESIFRGKPDATLRAAMHLRKSLGFAGDVVVPFLQTPWNITKLTIQRSPLYLRDAYEAYKEYKAGKIDAEVASERIARPVLGTMIGAFFYGIASQGGMTGSGPTDTKKRSLMLETGWQPYSFKIPLPDGGEVYLPYSRFEPVSGVLSMAADLAEADDPKMAENEFDKMTGSIVNALVNKTFLKGLSDAAMVASRPLEMGGQYARNLAGSAVPNIVRKGAQAIDPTLRDIRPKSKGVKGFGESVASAVASGVPGLTQTVPARVSATGKEIQRKGTKVGFFSPVKPTVSEPAEVERLLVDVGYAPGEPDRKLNVGSGASVILEDEEYAVLAEGRKAAAEYVRKKLLKNPEFNKLPNTVQEAPRGRQSKESVLKSVFSRYSRLAREEVWKRFPELRKRSAQAIKDVRGKKHSGFRGE